MDWEKAKDFLIVYALLHLLLAWGYVFILAIIRCVGFIEVTDTGVVVKWEAWGYLAVIAMLETVNAVMVKEMVDT